MDTKSLKYFLAVAEHRNFTKAAEGLYITQSALSHNIAELELELDTKLFLRTTRSVNLTQSGEILLKSAKDLISSFEKISTEIRKFNSGTSGELVIGHIFSPFTDFLPNLTRHFHNEYPDIKIRFIRKNMGPLMEIFLRKELDILFTMSFDFDRGQIIEGVEWKPLFPDGMSLVVRHDHPLATSSAIDYKLLAKERFISLEEGESPSFYPLMLQICAARGFVPDIAITPSTVEGVLMQVKAGFGVAIIPTSISQILVNDLRFIDLEGEDTKFSEIVAWRSDSNNPSVPFLLSSLNRFMEDPEN